MFGLLVLGLAGTSELFVEFLEYLWGHWPQPIVREI